MKRTAALTLLLLLAFPVSADPPKVPANVPAKAGEVVTFDVTVAAGKELGWQPAFDKADCLLVRLYSDDPGVYSFLAQPKKDGSFGVAFWTVGEKRGATLVIGGGSGPTPPQPPQPSDPFDVAVRAALGADTDVTDPATGIALPKSKAAAALASLYRTAAAGTVNDKSISSYGELFAVMKAASRRMLPESAIPATRKIIGNRLNGTLGTNAAAPIDRTLAGREFLAVAAALEAASR